MKYFIHSLVKLTVSRIKYGECFVVETGFCCDTGYFVSERRYTNPLHAVRWLRYLNSEEAERFADGSISGYIGNGNMWRDGKCFDPSHTWYGWR